MKNNLSNFFKEREQKYRLTVPSNSIVGVRLDGKSFHTFTKLFNRPYDENFMEAMNDTALFIIKNVLPQTLFGYVQSDEITLFFTDRQSKLTELPFAGKVEKILSVTASAASLGFHKSLPTSGLPLFDARVFVLESFNEVQEYMDWRRLDARKNAVTMAAGALYSEKELHGKTIRERHALLQGTEFEVLPEEFMNGRLIVKKTHDTGEREWINCPALRSDTEKLIKKNDFLI